MTIKKTILLVDDNPDDVLLTKRALERGRLINNVIVAYDGEQALNMLVGKGEYQDKAVEPELILLDLKMPKMSGHDLLKIIQHHETLSLIPVVVLTTSLEDEDLVKSYRLGANSFVRKPVDFAHFADAIEQLGMYWLVLNAGLKKNK